MSASATNSWGISGMLVEVTSSTHAAADLVGRIDRFVGVTLRKILADMAPAKYALFLRSLAARKVEPAMTLSDQSNTHWAAIKDLSWDFDEHLTDAALLEGITQADVLDFYDRFFADGAPERKVLDVRVLSRAARGPEREHDVPDGPVLVKDGVRTEAGAQVGDAVPARWAPVYSGSGGEAGK